MFSDKFYYIKVSCTLIVILGACFYSFLTFHLSQHLSESNNIILKYRRVLEIGENYFTYGSSAQKTSVFGDVSGIKRGDYVSFSALLLEDGNLKLNSFHIHKYRIYAVYLSVLPVIFVFWIVSRRLKWSKKGLSLSQEQ